MGKYDKHDLEIVQDVFRIDLTTQVYDISEQEALKLLRLLTEVIDRLFRLDGHIGSKNKGLFDSYPISGTEDISFSAIINCCMAAKEKFDCILSDETCTDMDRQNSEAIEMIIRDLVALSETNMLDDCGIQKLNGIINYTFTTYGRPKTGFDGRRYVVLGYIFGCIAIALEQFRWDVFGDFFNWSKICDIQEALLGTE